LGTKEAEYDATDTKPFHTELFWRWNWFASMETKRNYRYMKITPAEMMWNNVDRIEQKETGV
jgi:hypothetical protein